MVIKKESERIGEIGNPSHYRNLTSFEVDVLRLIYDKEEEKEKLVILSFDELRKKGGFSEKEYSDDQFCNKLIDLSIKLAGLVFHVTGEKNLRLLHRYSFFPLIERKRELLRKKS